MNKPPDPEKTTHVLRVFNFHITLTLDHRTTQMRVQWEPALGESMAVRRKVLPVYRRWRDEILAKHAERTGLPITLIDCWRS